ncbi:hypothetical protein CesoFtcFv8_004378 [Champsocephalus esox]|uniref:Uncharacterized protein n=1 Tax=Champsocephalus esox TaxID=159716 RepID=A0AAN8HFK0_9TELE|nr:hypothetical protein CesoFtcFv8_004378 [Champsocephalus esox]
MCTQSDTCFLGILALSLSAAFLSARHPGQSHRHVQNILSSKRYIGVSASEGSRGRSTSEFLMDELSD